MECEAGAVAVAVSRRIRGAMSTARAEKRPRQVGLGRKVVPAQLRVSSVVGASAAGV